MIMVFRGPGKIFRLATLQVERENSIHKSGAAIHGNGLAGNPVRVACTKLPATLLRNVVCPLIFYTDVDHALANF
jgi:hypothetical protein